MQLTPRYHGDPLISIDGPPDAVLGPTVRQRRRMVELLRTLDERQWAAPTRCSGWSVRDLVVHLDSTNTFWAFSVGAGRAGTPSTFLADFDPVASPAQLVARSQDRPEAVLASFEASTDALEGLLEGLTPEQWGTIAEAPPGHVAVTAVVHHALWDSWVHERDVTLPLGLPTTVEDDEVAAVLRYAAALGPALHLSLHGPRRGALALEATAPGVELTVEVHETVHVRDGITGAPDATLRGAAVDLAEALSVRAPAVEGLPPEAAWMTAGLEEVFEVSSS